MQKKSALILPMLLVLFAASIACGDDPFIRCALVRGAYERPWRRAKDQLTLVLKDIQWWYACQMAAHGYGPKTFAIEEDKNRRVDLYVLVAENTVFRADALPQDCCGVATLHFQKEKIEYGPNKSLALVVYCGYDWKDKKNYKVNTRGTSFIWFNAFFTAWHLRNVVPEGWLIDTPVREFEKADKLFGKQHARLVKENAGDLTVSQVVWDVHGQFARYLGHAFGLKGRQKGEEQVKGDMMGGDLWRIRGNFVPNIEDEWLCLHPKDAAFLNKSPLFKARRVSAPSTKATLEMGQRGVEKRD